MPSLRDQLIAQGLIKPAAPPVTRTCGSMKRRNDITNRTIGTTVKSSIDDLDDAQAVTCILCGKKIPKGHLLEHKSQIHGEKMYEASPVRKSSTNNWVNVVQGGLPSLGKNSR